MHSTQVLFNVATLFPLLGNLISQFCHTVRIQILKHFCQVLPMRESLLPIKSKLRWLLHIRQCLCERPYTFDRSIVSKDLLLKLQVMFLVINEKIVRKRIQTIHLQIILCELIPRVVIKLI